MKKVVIFSNSDSHFFYHLLPIATKAIDLGYQVSLITKVINHKEKIENLGIKVIPISLDRKGMNPLCEFFTLFRIISIIREARPDILHNFTIKPIIYGSIASLFCNSRPKIINNFIGMGFLFISQNLLHSFIKHMICLFLSKISGLDKVQTIVQNSDDKHLLNSYKIENVSVECSVGVDIDDFDILKEPKNNKTIFALVSRMLVDKGIYEFVEASEILHEKGIKAEFWLAGLPDEGNKSSLTIKEIEHFEKMGFIKYLGFQDVKKIWQKAHVAVLPSYREGMSRSLLEAGAYGRAIITTDSPGGRDLISHNVNGLLVPIKNPNALADAMEFMVLNPLIRKQFAEQIRKEIAIKYDSEVISAKMVRFYEEVDDRKR